MDLESIAAEISAAADTSRVNTEKIAETNEILRQASETVERLQSRNTALSERWAVSSGAEANSL